MIADERELLHDLKPQPLGLQIYEFTLTFRLISFLF